MKYRFSAIVSEGEEGVHRAGHAAFYESGGLLRSRVLI